MVVKDKDTDSILSGGEKTDFTRDEAFAVQDIMDDYHSGGAIKRTVVNK